MGSWALAPGDFLSESDFERSQPINAEQSEPCQNQPILATEKDLKSGITSTVQLYVRLKNLSALSKLKVHV